MDEFDLIARYFAPLDIPSPDVIIGIGDDAAVLAWPPGEHVVVAVDTLVDGVHFPRGLRADAVAHRLAAVNLSDMAAMGARPRYATLALTLPELDEAWLAAFARGLAGALGAAGVSLVGGDTTRGPLTLSLQVLGSVAGPALSRRGAQTGDVIAVSGTLGDARAGLDLALADPAARAEHPLLARFLWPTPRLALGQGLRALAHAAIDVSDGLLADLGHVMRHSGRGAAVDVSCLPVSPALLAAVGAERAREFALSGGDDYELALCIPPAALPAAHGLARQLAVPLTEIGHVTAGSGVHCLDAQGRDLTPAARGYRHFE
jgi:thiamine-monophosphate kinase